MFTNHFLHNELRRHRIQILMETEKSLFQNTLTVMEREDAHAAYVEAHARHVDLIHKISPRETAPLDLNLINEINNLRNTLKSLLQRVQELGIELDKKTERREFIRKCPTCPNGFLSSAWRCHLCKTRACKNCLGIKGIVPDGQPDPPHECKAEDVESARLIENATKPCPHCGVRVQKSEGCNQMWCTACNNAFDWRTGQKTNGPIHNPHFHEYQYRNNLPGTTQWLDACENNRDPAFWPWIYTSHLIAQLQRTLETRVFPSHWVNRILQFNRFMIERSVSAREYAPYTPASYEDLRKKRLRNQIDDAFWCSQLSSRETRREKSNKQRLLDELILAVGRDSCGVILQREKFTLKDFEETCWMPLESAKQYYNEQLLSWKENKQRYIDDTWTLRSK
jgi:hypothetical protein